MAKQVFEVGTAQPIRDGKGRFQHGHPALNGSGRPLGAKTQPSALRDLLNLLRSI
ncbi:hypothetical protein ACEK06_02780 [Pseudomonas brenneri]|jgi:hypothetical protein|uniref:hypothetical protein n=1 Tax=Pseudomonas TaxID=286 RepID=UPI001F20BD6E|nr:hypothetical protein [Pseudomonas lactis]